MRVCYLLQAVPLSQRTNTAVPFLNMCYSNFLLVQVQSVLARMNQNGGCISTGAQPHYNTGGRQGLYQE